MANDKRKSLDFHSNKLNSIEASIASICRAKGVSPDDLENHLDSFSVEDEEILLELLQKKLNLQESIFKMQGGRLDNVVFLVINRRSDTTKEYSKKILEERAIVVEKPENITDNVIFVDFVNKRRIS